MKRLILLAVCVAAVFAFAPVQATCTYTPEVNVCAPHGNNDACVFVDAGLGLPAPVGPTGDVLVSGTCADADGDSGSYGYTGLGPADYSVSRHQDGTIEYHGQGFGLCRDGYLDPATLEYGLNYC